MASPARSLEEAACDWAHRISTPLTSIILDLERVARDDVRLARVHRNLDELRGVLAELVAAERDGDARRQAEDEALVAPAA